jgi:hypothetical protein
MLNSQLGCLLGSWLNPGQGLGPKHPPCCVLELGFQVCFEVRPKLGFETSWTACVVELV